MQSWIGNTSYSLVCIVLLLYRWALHRSWLRLWRQLNRIRKNMSSRDKCISHRCSERLPLKSLLRDKRRLKWYFLLHLHDFLLPYPISWNAYVSHEIKSKHQRFTKKKSCCWATCNYILVSQISSVDIIFKVCFMASWSFKWIDFYRVFI